MSEERVAIVTGAAGAIGSESAKGLLELGYRVVLTDRSEAVADVAKSLDATGQVTSLICDLLSEPEIRKFGATVADTFGRIDVLVNNAGIHPKNEGQKYRIEEITLQQWQNVLFVNLTAPFLLYQIALPHMKRAKWGRVINIGSRAGRTISPLAAAHYSSSKAGIIGLTRVMAHEGASFGITANCVAPGPVATAISTPLADVRAAAVATIPVGRYGVAEEVASAVKYLASEASSFITGAIVDVNGGSFMP